MIFTSFEFIVFFAVVLIGRQLTASSFEKEKWFLLVMSYAFYASWSVPCLGLILFTSLVDYFVGLRLSVLGGDRQRKGLLTISLVLNLGVLAYFKYANFFLDNVSTIGNWMGIEVRFPHYDILLPVGVSFFTFQSMSYTIDVYRRQIEPCRSWRDFLLFVSFFPQLVAGPIVRAADFLPQLQQRARGTARDIEVGLALFAVGAVKKAVISDQIAPHVDLIFADPSQFDALTLLQGVVGYAIQIYCDFSGYTDMAVGVARMMGYRFLDNFRMPYSSFSITEFWRRWHISLSTWLRDYLYIPLGGNRKGEGRTYWNLFVTMLLGGLWHGASWNFVIWGILHGVALAAHKLWLRLMGPRKEPSVFAFRWFSTGFSWLATMAVVLLGWVFFRAQTLPQAWEFLARMTTAAEGTRLISPHILGAIAIIALVHLSVNKDREWTEEIVDSHPVTRFTAYATLLTIIVCLGATDAAPFIYFQF